MNNLEQKLIDTQKAIHDLQIKLRRMYMTGFDLAINKPITDKTIITKAITALRKIEKEIVDTLAK